MRSEIIINLNDKVGILLDNISNKIVREPNFIEIRNKIHGFNPIKVLGVQERETRHSKILAWLINPKGNHNFGDLFLKEFIKKVYLYNQLESGIFDKKLTSFKIVTEWKDTSTNKDSIDIVAISEELKFIIVIENKIKAKANKGQLKKYKEMIEKEFIGYTYLPIFLTVLGEEADEEPQWYKKFTHEEIYIILRDLKEKEITLRVNQINKQNKVLNFIEDYMDVLEELTNPSDSIFNKSLSLAKDYEYIIKNFEQHNFFSEEDIEVLEHIRNYLELLPNINFKKACHKFETEFCAEYYTNKSSAEEIISDSRFHKSKTEFWFSPYLLFDKINGNMYSSGWKSPSPLSYFFQINKSEITLYMELGPVTFNNPSKTVSSRDDILVVIKEDKHGEFTLIAPKREGTKKWVKLFSANQKEVDFSSPHQIFNIMKELYVNDFKEATDQAFCLLSDLFE